MRLILSILFLVPFITLADDKALNFNVSKLADNVFLYTSHKHVEPWGLVGANGLIVVEGKNAHVIDTPWTTEGTKALISWVKSKNLTLKSGIATHFHEDASGGIEMFNNLNINTYATALTNTLLESQGKQESNQVISTNVFEVVNNTIEVFYPGAGHSQDNVVVWLPQSKILFGGCFIKSLRSKNLGNTADASITDWPHSIQRVINKYPNIEVVVPGHGKAGNSDLLHHTSRLSLKNKNKPNS